MAVRKAAGFPAKCAASQAILENRFDQERPLPFDTLGLSTCADAPCLPRAGTSRPLLPLASLRVGMIAPLNCREDELAFPMPRGRCEFPPRSPALGRNHSRCGRVNWSNAASPH